ncbi:MAG: replication-associated recombination protein A [Clostridia bacterium]|nr:replication-associated recombination protein A [Clostridia bacterium]
MSLLSNETMPLAERMRPKNLDEFLGQEHIVGKNSALRRIITADKMSSCIFYGPPGTGKTTLAKIIANTTNSRFVILNAVSSGVGEAKKEIEEAKKFLELYGKKTYFLLDECHRWSKSQSDAVLEAIERGYIIFIGSTTENPFISMTRAIVSRCRVFEFKPLSKENIKEALNRALVDRERGFGALNIDISSDALDYLVNSSSGDARVALGALELAVLSTDMVNKKIKITLETAKECMQGRVLSLDNDIFYDMLSAFCKSLRGSSPEGALYWAHRLIKSGCDPLVIFRRMLAHASEDVGLANTNCMQVVVSAMTAYEKIGLPEGLLPLSHAIIYVCVSPKSNSVLLAMHKAMDDVDKTFNDAVPGHLKNYNYLNEKRDGYLYPHDFGGFVSQQYLPDAICDHVYYEPSKNGAEKNINVPPPFVPKKLKKEVRNKEKTNDNR